VKADVTKDDPEFIGHTYYGQVPIMKQHHQKGLNKYGTATFPCRSQKVPAWPLDDIDCHFIAGGDTGRQQFKVVIHLVREMLSSITSMACSEPVLSPDYQSFYARHIPGFDALRGIDRMKECTGSRDYKPRLGHTNKCGNRVVLGMQMYIGWHKYLNDLMQATGGYRFKLEDLAGANGDVKRKEVVDEIYTQLNRPVPSTKAIVDAANHMRKGRTNSRQHRSTLTWQELFDADFELATKAWELAKIFQYDYSNTFDPAKYKPTPGLSIVNGTPSVAPPSCKMEKHQTRTTIPRPKTITAQTKHTQELQAAMNKAKAHKAAAEREIVQIAAEMAKD
jgi:hypothetical protein